jgi:preprotein translocase subunit SecE
VTISSADLRVRGAFFYLQASIVIVAKTSPGEFIRQVRAETAKVHWQTRKETVATGILVGIMTTMLAVFFFGVDAFLSTLVKMLLGLLA